MGKEMESKYWCFTLNNYTNEERTKIELNEDYDYLVYGYEVGESGTPHLQGYIELKKKKRLTALKKISNRANWGKRLGTSEEASKYCKKGEQSHEEWKELKWNGPNWGKNAVIKEIGVISVSNQGERNDLKKIYKDIENGKKVDDIAVEDPELFHQYGRTLNKLEDIALRKKYRTEMTKGTWLYGKTGVGKSHQAFEGFHPDTHYLLPNDNGWWDGYTGQETVIINDFRGEIPYNQMLQMIDKWPFQVKRRNREPVPFISKHVIITSSLPPDSIYKNRNEEDKIEQLTRRLNIIELKSATEVLGGNTNPERAETLQEQLNTLTGGASP